MLVFKLNPLGCNRYKQKQKQKQNLPNEEQVTVVIVDKKINWWKWHRFNQSLFNLRKKNYVY